ncbi:MAG TPA: hypothetical protein VGK63_02960, partial [Candidatus Limnocylindrales bacterium]
ASGGGVPANVASGSAAFALATGIVVYGAAGVVGAVGIWGRRPWGRWTAIAVDAVGIAILAWAIALAGPGDVLVSGTALLAIAAALAFFARP